MKKYVEIFIKSKEVVTHSMRAALVNSLWGSSEDHKYGMMEKFNKAYGYAPVSYDSTKEYPKVNMPIEETPEDYRSPVSYLTQGMMIDLSEYSLVKFIVPMGIEEHPNKKYMYNHKWMALNFAEFLRKVYPNYEVSTAIVEDYGYDMVKSIESFIYISFVLDERIREKYSCQADVECSAGRLLTNEEKESIYKNLDGLVDFPWEIEQFFCETCKSYDENEPYHTEVKYL